MRILDEAAVRQLYIKKQVRQLFAEDYDYITPQAEAYIRHKKIQLQEKRTPVHTEIHPYTEDIRHEQIQTIPASKKPEYMTHLYGSRLVVKTHPRIVLRGKLDSLQADIVFYQIRLSHPKLQKALDDIMKFTHAILSAEVTGKPFSCDLLMEHTAEEVHEMSHYPKKMIGVDHVFPSKEMGEYAAAMNVLRARSREVELAAVDAFYRDGEMERVDLIQAFNRLSSAFYVLECRCVAGEFTK